MSESDSHSLSDILAAMTEVAETDDSLKKKFNAIVRFDVEGQTLTLDVRKDRSGSQESAPICK
jgi:hypothetical protein